MKHRLLRAFEPSELRWDLWPEPPVVLRGIVYVRMGKVMDWMKLNPFWQVSRVSWL